MKNDGLWADDKLGRQHDADFLESYLRRSAEDLIKREVRKSFVLNLDAGWGRGKTFFLERFKQQVEASGHLAAYVNAWQDDFADDPLTAVMAAIDDVVSSNVKQNSKSAEIWETTKRTAGKVALQVGKGLLLRGMGLLITEAVATSIESTVATAISSDQADKAADAVSGDATAAMERALDERLEQTVSEFASNKKMIAQFRSQLSAFVESLEQLGKAPPFFIFIDELDRCRPPYAISMLERVKHLFEIPKVAFVIATDAGELKHSIRAVYGDGFNSSKYLKRFFDSSFEFESPGVSEFVASLIDTNPIDPHLFATPNGDDFSSVMANFFYAVDADLRTVEQCYNTLRAISLTWESKIEIELALILPLIFFYYSDTQILSNFGSAEKALRQNTRNPWTTVTLDYSDDGYSEKRKVEDLLPLARQIWETAHGSMYGTVKSGDQSYATRVISNELQRLHSGIIRGPKDEPTSVIRTYPRLIRQAGRVDNTISDLKA